LQEQIPRMMKTHRKLIQMMQHCFPQQTCQTPQKRLQKNTEKRQAKDCHCDHCKRKRERQKWQMQKRMP
jgi:hypothetical protein